MCKDCTRVNCPWFPNSVLCTCIPSTHFSFFFFCEAFLLTSLVLPATQEIHSKFLSGFFVLNCYGSVFFPGKQPVHAQSTEVSLLFVVLSIHLGEGRCMCMCVCACACTNVHRRHKGHFGFNMFSLHSNPVGFLWLELNVWLRLSRLGKWWGFPFWQILKLPSSGLMTLGGVFSSSYIVPHMALCQR
jgi:hypothetical protein